MGSSAVWAGCLKLARCTLAGHGAPRREKEQSKAGNDKNRWTQNVWKCFPLWHSKILTHENKAHLWSSDWSLLPILPCSARGVWVYIGMLLLLFQGDILHLGTAENKHTHIHTLGWNLNLTVTFLSCWKEQILLSNRVRTWLHIQTFEVIHLSFVELYLFYLFHHWGKS